MSKIFNGSLFIVLMFAMSVCAEEQWAGLADWPHLETLFDAIEQKDAEAVNNLVRTPERRIFRADGQVLLGHKDQYGQSALAFALRKLMNKAVDNRSIDLDRVNICKILIDGSDLSAQDFNGETPLMAFIHGLSSYKFQYENGESLDSLLELLLQKGSDVNAQDKYGHTVLMRAFMERLPEKTLRILINSDADVNSYRDWQGRSLLFYTIINKNNASPYLVQLLLDAHVDVNQEVDKNGNTVLMHVLSCKGYENTIGSILAAGADINAANNNRETPLMVAVSNQSSPEIISTLLCKGANPNAKDEHGHTPLMGEVSLRRQPNDLERLELLLAFGSDVNAKDNQGITPLMHAANSMNTSAHSYEFNKAQYLYMDILLAQGADINARDKYGRTAITILSYRWHRDSYLLDMTLDNPILAEALCKNHKDLASTHFINALETNNYIRACKFIDAGLDLTEHVSSTSTETLQEMAKEHGL